MNVAIIVISKDEPQLDDTLTDLVHETGHAGGAPGRDAQDDGSEPRAEVVVVDASAHRLEAVHQRHPWVKWVDFSPPPGVAVSIPHQRNAGLSATDAELIVFIDAGCRPQAGWLERLLEPLSQGEEAITAGLTLDHRHYGFGHLEPAERYLPEAPTINLAFHRKVFQAIGPFDETFAYGSDIDFTWRATDHGFRIRSVPDAVVDHDWGDLRRRFKRARQYGGARLRLYWKHPHRVPSALRHDPVPFIYPLWIMGLPLARRRPWYLLLLMVPLWRARRYPSPPEVVVRHLVEGLGVLESLFQLTWKSASSRSRR